MGILPVAQSAIVAPACARNSHVDLTNNILHKRAHPPTRTHSHTPVHTHTEAGEQGVHVQAAITAQVPDHVREAVHQEQLLPREEPHYRQLPRQEPGAQGLYVGRSPALFNLRESMEITFLRPKEDQPS